MELTNEFTVGIPLDEAWAVTSTPQGAKLIPEVSRMGRSRNTALILISQNAGDLLNEQVTNSLSAVFAFRSTDRSEVASVMSLLGVEATEEHLAVLRSLGNGECVFRDLDGRAGRIAVDLISDELRHWLDTNPTRAPERHVPVPAHPAAPVVAGPGRTAGPESAVPGGPSGAAHSGSARPGSAAAAGAPAAGAPVVSAPTADMAGQAGTGWPGGIGWPGAAARTASGGRAAASGRARSADPPPARGVPAREGTSPST